MGKIPGKEDLPLGPLGRTQQCRVHDLSHGTHTRGCQVAFPGPVPGIRQGWRQQAAAQVQGGAAHANTAHWGGVLSGTLTSLWSPDQDLTMVWIGSQWSSLTLDLHARRGALTTTGALICPRLCPDSSSWSWTELGSVTKLTVRQTCQAAAEGQREKMGALNISYPTVGMWFDLMAWRQ